MRSVRPDIVVGIGLAATGLPVTARNACCARFVVDYDGDGDADLLASLDSPLRAFTNDGAGGFSAVTQSLLPMTPSEAWGVAAADYDRDGDIDVLRRLRGGRHKVACLRRGCDTPSDHRRAPSIG